MTDHHIVCHNGASIRSINESYGMINLGSSAQITPCDTNIVAAEQKADIYFDESIGAGNFRIAAKVTRAETGRLSAEAASSATLCRDDTQEGLGFRSSLNADFGVGGGVVDADAHANLYAVNITHKASVVDSRLEVGKAYASAGVGGGPGGVKLAAFAGVDFINTTAHFDKGRSLTACIGFNVDSGVDIGWEGVGAKFMGFGLAAGRTSGLHTPFWGISFTAW